MGALATGRGVSLVPDYLCADALHQRRLQRLWPEAVPAVNKLYVATGRVSAYPQEVALLTALLAASGISVVLHGYSQFGIQGLEKGIEGAGHGVES